MENMVNKWRINRAGLLNFWYYDDEEFQFADGRLLLRGSNGSGKSVTMQSLITVLLDGVKTPDRLDSFGSRSRRMEDYLLGEKEIVNRDERTGYLYLEYKREQTEQYLTTGIGLQARRNGSLDFWGFVITDNRRIKTGLQLYKSEISPQDGSTQNIPLTRAELERTIGGSGHVVRTQKEYMELVNRYIFGFETTDQYQELMKLLIQLRSPKLSKDFKPSVIYEILNESLPSLSDDELRPLSDTIESMERTKLQIGQLERDHQALGRLCRQYDLYNSFVLAEKADLAQKSRLRLARLDREAAELAARIENDRQLLVAELQRQNELDRESTVLNREKQELEQHDVFRAEQQKQERENRLTQALAAQKDKEHQLAVKKRRENEELDQARHYEQQAEECQTRMDQLLLDLDATATATGFADHRLLVQAFTQNSPAFSFEVWQQNTQNHLARLEAVLEVLRRQAETRQRRDRIDQELGEERRRLDEYRAEMWRLEQQFMAVREGLLAEFYQWHQQYAALIPMEQDELRLVAQAIQGLYEGHVWNEAETPVEGAFARQITTLSQELGILNAKISQLEQQEQKLTIELKEWQNKTDPEPERLPDSQATRDLLIKGQIPFLPLYAAAEFRSEISAIQRERLEAALAELGLLDALIISPHRLREIPATETYGAIIHPNPQIICATLADYLYPTPVKGNEITAAEIDAVLRTIIIDPEMAWSESTGSDTTGLPRLCVSEGSYGIGAISGRAPRREAAVFIGKQARHEYRRQQIERLEQQLADLGLKQTALFDACNRLREQQEQVRLARKAFLDERPIREIHHAKQAVTANIARQEQTVEQYDRRLREVAVQLQTLREQLQNISAGLKLPGDESAYYEALQEMRLYQRDLQELRLYWSDYRNNRHNAGQCRERLTDLTADVDGLRGELMVWQSQIDAFQMELVQINLRLQELGGEELRERVRQLALRLEAIPREIRATTENATRLETGLQSHTSQLQQLTGKLHFYRQINHCWQQILEDEFRFGLVFADNPPLETVAADLNRLKEKLLKQDKLDRLTVSERLLKSFHIENNVLMEYRMQLEPVTTLQPENLPQVPESGDPEGVMADELEKLQEKARRDLLTLDYESRRHTPYQMQQLLQRQMDEQKAILSEKDKALYEEVIMNSIGRIISRRIHAAQQWVAQMNQLMQQRDNSSGLRFKLEWKPRLAEAETEMDVQELVRLLHGDPATLKQQDLQMMMYHFQTRIERAKRTSEGLDSNHENAVTFQQAVREVLDYRMWFQFKLHYEQGSQIPWRELTDKMFFKFSGGEKAMAMYIPLFSAAYSRYQEARADAPYIITLDEAFAGVDENNIRDTFALVEQLGFNYIMNSQALWGDYDVVPQLAICELIRPKNAAFVTVVRYHWNGRVRSLDVAMDPENLVAAAAQPE